MDFKLPDIGEGVHEGELVRWLVKEGDSVGVDQPIVEIMTDKATVEIPTPHAGKVQKLMAKEGDMIKVGQTIMTLGEGAGAAASAPSAQPAAAKPAAPAMTAPKPSAPALGARPAMPAAAPSRPTAPMQAKAASPTMSAPSAVSSASYMASPGQVLATPATRRLARDLGVDLTQVPATGPHGRVTKEDVQQFVGATAAGPQMPVHTPGYAPMYTPSTGGHGSAGPRETLIPFRGIRRKISEAMVRSRHTIADFSYVDECDISELVAFRKESKAYAEKLGVKLTYMPFICKAVVQGLKAFPKMNSVLDEQGGNIIVKNYYNLGIAVDTEDGLVVPVVKDIDRKSIVQIAKEMQELADKARHKKLSLEDMQGGTFTITNAGNIGGMLATPIINYPEMGIFGVHKISRRPVVRNVNGKEEIAIGDVIWLSVSVDHRVVDGADAARFMNIVMDYLANPKKMLLEMA